MVHPNWRLAQRTEIAPSEFPIVPSYQMDRGKLENDLRAFAEDAGIKIYEGAKLRDVVIAGCGSHRLDFTFSNRKHKAHCRWFVDATGRARFLSKRLELHRSSGHLAHSVWFRIKGRLRIGDLVPPENAAWHARDVDDNRWQSTNHLMGAGYWVWVIPLTEQSAVNDVSVETHTSVGIVVDGHCHDFSAIHSEHGARAWLQKHEPELATRLQDASFQDFRVLKDFSHTTERMLSPQRWACVGEAAAFVDPLYSTGSDFIGLANCYVTSAIIKDFQGEHDAQRIETQNEFFKDFVENTVTMFCNNQDIFPAPEVMGAKLWWDFYYYWAWFGIYFFNRLYELPTSELAQVHDKARVFLELNSRAQRLLQIWASARVFEGAAPGFIPLPMFPSFLASLHIELETAREPEQARRRIEELLANCRTLFTELVLRALRGSEVSVHEDIREIADLSDLARDGELIGRMIAEDADRKTRRAALSGFARDLERALGRMPPGKPLRELMQI